MEINARLAGGMIPELIRLATGADVLTDQIRVAARLPVAGAAPATRHAGIRFLVADTAGTMAGVSGVDAARAVPGVTSVTVTAAPGQAVRPPRNAYDRLGYVIAAGESPGAVRSALDAALAHLRLEIE